jgi:signal transduction histidine kinase
VSVKDTGIGIPVDEKEKVFERFYQADNSMMKKHKGTGLGLSISKSIIEIMNGEIDVESEDGKGSCFYFVITLKRPEDQG